MASRIAAIELLRERIATIKAAPERVAMLAAPKIQARLVDDSTTGRGNVPSFGKFGSVQTSAVPIGPTIEVTAADWVMKTAQDKGQVDAWLGIVSDTAREELVRGTR